ncbi:MAG: hypothetical protein ACJAWZ_003879 [Paracoccaceae bacterium]
MHARSHAPSAPSILEVDRESGMRCEASSDNQFEP